MEQYDEVNATGMGRRVVGEWLDAVVPVPMKWDLRRCNNWRGISLVLRSQNGILFQLRLHKRRSGD